MSVRKHLFNERRWKGRAGRLDRRNSYSSARARKPDVAALSDGSGGLNTAIHLAGLHSFGGSVKCYGRAMGGIGKNLPEVAAIYGKHAGGAAHPEAAMRVLEYLMNVVAGQTVFGRKVRELAVFE